MTSTVVPVQPYCLRHDIGEQIKERYTIREVLGAGAFGTVYRVEEMLGARVVTLACKEMHVLSDPDSTGDERDAALRMFQEEAYLLQTLRHPNIPAAYFESAKGVWLACPRCGRTFKGARVCPDHGSALQVVRERFYLVMDFLDGPDLEQMLEANGGRPLEEEAVLDWAVQVCDALEAVHEKGLSHRDIKPANIKIHHSQRAMLIDFGLVKPANVAGGYGTVLKRGSTGVGTLGYAPESQHEQMHPDARTDILALGMTLYRLLTGLDPTEPGDLATMRRTRPSGCNIHLSPLVDDIIGRAIQFDPNKRYPDVAQLRQDLRAARYPVETTCDWCGHVQRSARRPEADTPCDRCGRPLGGARGGVKSGAAGRKSGAQSPSAPRAPKPAQPNPHQRRIDEIRAMLLPPVQSVPHPHDARIAELEAQLADVGRHAAGALGQTARCPSCRRADLLQVTGQPTGRCPLCDAGQLSRRDWNNALCAICREGELRERHLRGDTMFCAVCRAAPLQEKQRKQFVGLVVDVWAACPHCRAEFDIQNGGRASLESYEDDSFSVGALHGKETLPITEWKKLSGRSDDGCDCTHCGAQFDARPDGLLTLARFNSDPHGIVTRVGGQALSRDDWGKLAHGLSPLMGNLHCGHCRAEWDFDRDQKTLKLLGCESGLPPWAESLRGRTLALTAWHAAAAGKSSARPGWLCPSCRTEFDIEGNVLKLVAAPPIPSGAGSSNANTSGANPLLPYVGQLLPLQDWQRRAHNLPTGSEAQSLRNELQRLEAARQNDRAEEAQRQSRQRTALEAELLELLKLSVIGGHVPIKRLSHYAAGSAANGATGGTAAGGAAAGGASSDSFITLRDGSRRVPLRASEELRWESPARKCSVQLAAGRFQWQREADGTLIVSTERVLFHCKGARWEDDVLWQRSLDTLRAVAAATGARSRRAARAGARP